MSRGMRIISVVLLISLGAVRKGEVYGHDTTSESPQFDENKDTGTNLQLSKVKTLLNEWLLEANGQDTKMDTNQDNPALKTAAGDDLTKSVFSRTRRSNANSHGLTPDQYYLKLMSMLTSKENGYQPAKERIVAKESETDFVDDDDEGEVIELYGSNPYPFSSIESAEKRPHSDKAKTYGGDTISLMRSRPPSGTVGGDLWDDIGEGHNQGVERRSRSPGRLLPVNGLQHYRVANSKREFSPFERRVFTQPYQRLVRRSFGSFFG